MDGNEVIDICRLLKTNSISLSPDNQWLLGCIDWYKSQNDMVNTQQLQEYVCNQWLLADLHDIQETCLPTSAPDVYNLTGKYAVQVNWIRDIGQSSYSQLKKLQVSNETNETLTLDKPEKWEPRPTRMFMMEITDGVTTVHAMEYTHINKLQEPFFPGTKILISGPVEYRKGVFLLQENNITILGGEVFSLLHSNSIENVLARSLNLEDQGTHDQTPTTQLNNIHEEPIDLLASDEDEALLLQIPTETLPITVVNSSSDNEQRIHLRQVSNTTNTSSKFTRTNELNNFKRSLAKLGNQPILLSNVNERIIPSEPKINRIVSERVVPSEPQVNRPISERTSESQVNRFKTERRPSEEVSRPTSFRHDDEVPSTSNLNQINRTEGITPLSKSLPSVPNSLDYSMTFDDEEDIIFSSLEEQPQFPYCKQIVGTVQSMTNKLKIRDGEWTATAMITDGSKSFEVQFSSEVLENIFGISAAEIQAKRSEMASNPAIKERVNTILKNGQQKLKSMKCPMTIEYFSSSELPKVVIVEG